MAKISNVVTLRQAQGDAGERESADLDECLDRYDVLLAQTFPASDPLPLWD